jgi:hypothetical protein
MSRKTVVALASAVTLSAWNVASAQPKMIQGATVTGSATVEAVEQSSRMLTLRDSDGELHSMKVPQDVQGFSEIKPGDTVTATYFDNFSLTPKAPGEPDVDTLKSAVAGTAGRPGGAATAQRRITATVSAVDMDVPSISFTGPQGWKYSTKVKDKADLDGVKVGDRFDVAWTEGVLVSLGSPKQ